MEPFPHDSGRTLRLLSTLPKASSAAQAKRPGAVLSTPSRYGEEAERACLVHRGLSQLPRPDQEIVDLRTFQGFSFNEIAYLLTIDAATARKRFGRALLRLRKILFLGDFWESAS
jgi:RNA polymerase sigma-70 factor, ECF subfamily